MTPSESLCTSPVLRVGDRLFLVICRQERIHWDCGCIGRCRPVALVVVEDGQCFTVGLERALRPDEIPPLVERACGLGICP
ncbi:MAG: hypothetical protein NQU46_02535 [Methanolinea sp.]|nr:hypothetical protein [Methanolinea sp.]